MRTDVETDSIPITDGGVALGELAMGEVTDKWPAALREVVANCLSFDYPVGTKREVNIKVVFTPSDDRTNAEVEVAVSTKLAPKRPAKTKLYFTPAGDEIVVSEDNPQQPRLAFK